MYNSRNQYYPSACHVTDVTVYNQETKHVLLTWDKVGGPRPGSETTAAGLLQKGCSRLFKHVYTCASRPNPLSFNQSHWPWLINVHLDFLFFCCLQIKRHLPGKYLQGMYSTPLVNPFPRTRIPILCTECAALLLSRSYQSRHGKGEILQ